MIPASKPVSGVEVTESNEMSNIRPELRAWSGNPLEQMARKLLELDRKVVKLDGEMAGARVYVLAESVAILTDVVNSLVKRIERMEDRPEVRKEEPVYAVPKPHKWQARTTGMPGFVCGNCYALSSEPHDRPECDYIE